MAAPKFESDAEENPGRTPGTDRHADRKHGLEAVRCDATVTDRETGERRRCRKLAPAGSTSGRCKSHTRTKVLDAAAARRRTLAEVREIASELGIQLVEARARVVTELVPVALDRLRELLDSESPAAQLKAVELVGRFAQLGVDSPSSPGTQVIVQAQQAAVTVERSEDAARVVAERLDRLRAAARPVEGVVIASRYSDDEDEPQNAS